VTLLVQAAADAAQAGAGAVHAGFHPVAPWLILALPLLGFVVNGLAAVAAARRALPVVPPVGDPHWDAPHGDALVDPSEQEGHDRGTDPHPVDAAAADHAHGTDDDAHDAHDRPAGTKPWTHLLPSIVAPLAVLGAFVVAVLNWLAMRGAHEFEPVRGWSWMPAGELQVAVDLLLDPLSMVMTLVVTGVGFLIHVFSIGYMREDPGYPRYMAYLNLFIFFMLVLVLGASYPVMFVGWEGVGLCSYLLIGFWFSEKANADAGKKAFIVNRIGDFGFLIAMFLLFAHLGTLDFAGVDEALAGGGLPFGGAVVTAICLFLLLGAAGKSAQIPLYVWLPDAMAGPTPVSALIHAATMVTAGVYLVVRSSVLFTLAPMASLVVAIVGTLTALFAATIGLKQWDIKRVLAYSTVSQLGFMFAAVGMGAYVAGIFHLMTHAFFKACLFLGAGAVIHAMHHALHTTHNPADAQDMRNMGGLRRYLPVTFGTMAVATLAIAGVPPFAGFVSKDEIIGAAWLGSGGANPLASGLAGVNVDGRPFFVVIGVLLSLTAALTAFYMGRMMIYTFFGRFRSGEAEERHLHEGGWTLTVPLVVLALLSLVGGWLNVDRHVPIVNLLPAIGGELALHEWLHPVLTPAETFVREQLPALAEPHHSAVPIVLAIVIGIGGLAVAWLLLAPRNERIGTADVEPAYRGGLQRMLYHKWYVDEAYDRVVVRPVGLLSRAQWAFDRGLDVTVDLFGRVAQVLGLWLGRVQSGYINTYAFVLLVGVLLLLGGFVAR
jgi:NADH-quinone oxidoreductase subunit L